MKVLWIGPNGGNYKQSSVSGTGGWIGALQNEIIKRDKSLELGITFLSETDSEILKDENVTYFPIKYSRGKSLIQRLFYSLVRNYRKEERILSYRINDVIEFYCPDLIHIWGVEGIHAGVIPLIKCPFVVHIQGLCSQTVYKHLPNGYSALDLFLADFPFRLLLKKGSYNNYKQLCRKAKREQELSKYINNWIGRTEFDRVAANLLHPGSRYFHCDEIMRAGFYGKKWSYHYDGKKIFIISSIRPDWLKGLDIILHTAQLLAFLEIPIEWDVFGIDEKEYRSRYTVRKLKIKPHEVGVRLQGSVTSEVICKHLLKADVYVHTSYIENSSNAIAEAMLLGVPTIAQFVGGNPTMLRNNSGKLVASNEPYALASAILDMCNKEIAEGYSNRALSVSTERQETSIIINDLFNAYHTIIKRDE